MISSNVLEYSDLNKYVSEEDSEIRTFGHLGIIAMSGCESMCAVIDDYLKEWRYSNDGYLIKHKNPRFATGEAKGVINQSVRGYDIFIICDCFNYGVTYEMYGEKTRMSPDDHFQDLKRTIAALGGKARRINVIMPMLYEGRQHKRFGRESLDCALALQELVGMGVSNILTFDAHDPRVQNAIPLAGFDTIAPTYQMIKAIYKYVDDIDLSKDKALIVSPDEGGMSRCMYYSSILGVDLGMFYKRRDYSKVVNSRNPIIAHEFLGNDVEGKDIIVVDDMIATGDSFIKIARKLKDMGAKRIFAFSTFGLFCEGLQIFDEAYEEKLIDKIFTTNLTYHTPALLEREWHAEVNLSKYLAFIIDALNYDLSISKYLDPAAKIKTLLAEKGNRVASPF